jgi:hypothetical protein
VVANLAPVNVKLLVTLNTPQDSGRVRARGVTVLAEYPNSFLVLATQAQRQQLVASNGATLTP